MAKIDKHSALIIVDVQRDFCPGGALPVPRGDEVIPILNKYIRLFKEVGASIYATRDWHPPNHASFKAYGGTWPPHCVQGSRGAEFHPSLELSRDVRIISKAQEPWQEAYSAFEGTGLRDDLKGRNIWRVFIGGLATEYCVKSTVLDALKAGFETILLEDAVMGIDAEIGDVERAVKEMMEKGAKKATLSSIIGRDDP
jgi:nicotinamidase/pyrazinamidase